MGRCNHNLALKNLRQMEKGDFALIYHTGDEKQIVGVAEIVRGFYVNPELNDENSRCAMSKRGRNSQNR